MALYVNQEINKAGGKYQVVLGQTHLAFPITIDELTCCTVVIFIIWFSTEVTSIV